MVNQTQAAAMRGRKTSNFLQKIASGSYPGALNTIKGSNSSSKSSSSGGLIDLDEGGMIESFRRMDHNGQASSDGKKVVLFDGTGTSQDWIIASGYLRRAFDAANIWNMVDPSQGQPIAAPPGAPLVEDAFNTPPPGPLDIPASQAARVLEINNAFAQTNADALAQFPGNGGAATGARNDVMKQAIVSRNDALREVNTSYVDELTRDHNKRVEGWEKARDAHADKSKRVYQIFCDRLGVSCHSVIQAQLNTRSFRAAWVTLNSTYGALRAGQNSADVIEQLNNAVWDATKYSFGDFVTIMENLMLTSTQLGNVYPDDARIAFIKQGVRKSQWNQALHEVMEFSRQSRDNYVQFKTRIVEKINELKTEYAKASMSGDLEGSTLNKMGNEDGEEIYCSADLVCNKCGGKGHFGWQCATKTNIPTRKPEKAKGANDKKSGGKHRKQCPICKKFHLGACWYADEKKGNRNKAKGAKDQSEKTTDDEDIKLANTLKNKMKSNKEKHKSLRQRVSSFEPDDEYSFEDDSDEQDEYVFMFDSGATSHMSPYLDIFDEKSLRVHKEEISLADEQYSVQAEAKGVCRNRPDLGEFMYVKNLNEGIIAVSQLALNGWKVIFDNDKVVVLGEDGYPRLLGTRKGKLYFLDSSYVHQLVEQSIGSHESNSLYQISNVEKPTEQTKEKLVDDVRGDVTRKRYKSFYSKDPLAHLHNCWGHLNIDDIKDAIRNKMVIGHGIDNYDKIRETKAGLCVDCTKGKMTQFLIESSESDHSERSPFDLVAVDEKGPFKNQSIKGYLRMDLFLFHTSHWGAVRFKRLKNEFLENFENLLIEIETEFEGAKPKIFQSDDENIYTDQKVGTFLSENRIKRQTSVPYKKQMNGLIENFVKTIMGSSTTVMNVYNCPLRFWDYCVDTVIYLRNRSPCAALGGMTPYEKVYGIKPDISHFVPFYAPGVYYLTKEEREQNVMANHSEECRMLGYSETQKDAYVIWVPKKNRVMVRRDCIFDESLHPRLDPDEPIDITQVSGNFQQLTIPEPEDQLTISQDLDFFNRALMPPTIDEPEEIEQSITQHIPDGILGMDYVDEIPNELIFERPPLEIPTNLSEKDGRRKVNIPQFVPISKSRSKRNRPGKMMHRDDYVAMERHNLRNKLPRFDYRNPMASRPMSIKLKQDSDEEYATLRVKVPGQKCMKIKVQKLDLPPIPKNEDEALNGPWRDQWMEAMMKEIESIDSFNTFKKAPQEGKAAKSKFVFDVMYDNNGDIKFKARLVLCGYSQIRGVNYDQTFAPTIMKCSIFLVLNLLINGNWYSVILDIGNAFLEGMNDYEIFMFLPDILVDESYGRRVRVVRSLYGEKQAAFVWYMNISQILMEQLGFEKSDIDNCIFYLKDGNNEIIMIACLHVDDFLIIAKSKELIDTMLKNLQNHVRKAKVYENYIKYLGIEIDQSEEDLLILHQHTYVKQVTMEWNEEERIPTEEENKELQEV